MLPVCCLYGVCVPQNADRPLFSPTLKKANHNGRLRPMGKAFRYRILNKSLFDNEFHHLISILALDPYEVSALSQSANLEAGLTIARTLDSLYKD